MQHPSTFPSFRKLSSSNGAGLSFSLEGITSAQPQVAKGADTSMAEKAALACSLGFVNYGWRRTGILQPLIETCPVRLFPRNDICQWRRLGILPLVMGRSQVRVLPSSRGCSSVGRAATSPLSPVPWQTFLKADGVAFGYFNFGS